MTSDERIDRLQNDVVRYRQRHVEDKERIRKLEQLCRDIYIDLELSVQRDYTRSMQDLGLFLRAGLMEEYE